MIKRKNPQLLKKLKVFSSFLKFKNIIDTQKSLALLVCSAATAVVSMLAKSCRRQLWSSFKIFDKFNKIKLSCGEFKSEILKGIHKS